MNQFVQVQCQAFPILFDSLLSHPLQDAPLYCESSFPSVFRLNGGENFRGKREEKAPWLEKLPLLPYHQIQP